MLPKARKESLIVREVGGDVVIYDEKRHRAHSLNAATAAVWRHCDGKTSEAEIATLLRKELRVTMVEEFVSLAINSLAKVHLLEQDLEPVTAAPRLTRRDVLRKLAVAGVMAPIVASMLVHAPQVAACVVSVQCPVQGRGQNCSGACPSGTTCKGTFNSACICG